MDIIAERTLDLVGQPVVVRIHRPTQQPTGEWACMLEMDGPRPHRREYRGYDSMGALFGALWVAQGELEGYGDQLKYRDGKPWIEIGPLV